MKYLRFQLLAALLCLPFMGWAQANVLRVDSVEGPAGKTVTLPIVMENQSDIAGVQFDILVPYQLATDDDGHVAVALSKTRAQGFNVATRYIDTEYYYYIQPGGTGSQRLGGHKYRIIVYSDDNALILDNSGTLLTLQLTTSTDLTDKTVLPVTLSNVTLTDLEMNNRLSATQNAAITIKEIPRPDLTPTDITFDKAQVAPGDTVSVQWKVKNIGTANTSGGWSEEISLVSNDSINIKVLGTTHYSDSLLANSEVSRNAVLTLPALMGIDGIVQVQVTIIPDADAGEHQSLRDNNTARSANNMQVAKHLTLEISPTRVNESDYWQRISVKLTRSGNRLDTQSFRVTTTDSKGQPSTESRISLPEIINIQSGESANITYLNITNNTVLDADTLIHFLVEAINTTSGYNPVEADLVIIDDEQPTLSVTASKTDLVEGTDATFKLTVTTERAPSTDLTVTITSEDTQRFKTFPATITIPAGETSAQLTVTVVNDDTANGTTTNKFTASAPNHNKGETLVTLSDDDLPVLELTITPTQVQEGDGPVCVAASLKRLSNTDKKVTVRLTDDSNGALYFGNRQFTLDKGVQEVTFNFGPVDNQEQDGDRVYTITAAVRLSSCSCDATGELAGHVQAQLTVLDDDGKALRLTSANGTVKEGGSTTLTVTRNTNDNSQPLDVTITSDFDAELSYTHNVTIPAGEKSVDVEVTSLMNDVSGDSHTVVFTVSASDFASGTCWLMVTDQTLPDAVFKGISANPASCLVGDAVTLTLLVANEGNNASLPANTTIDIYEEGTSEALASIILNDPLAVGDERAIEKTLTLPKTVGTHRLYAVLNKNKTVQELSTTNNTSATISVEVTSPFMATLQADKDKYNQTDVAIFTGQLTGRDFADAEFDLYIVADGVRQSQRVRADGQGQFEYRWPLSSAFMGHCIAGVCYPGDDARAEITAFDVYGLRRTSTGYIKFQPTVGDEVQTAIELENPGVLQLTGVKVEVEEQPDNFDLNVSLPETIAGGEKPLLTYSFTATAPSTGSNWQTIKLNVTSNEGVELPITIHLFARMAEANLITPNQRITTTMTLGQTREYPVTLINNGQGSTGLVTLALPDWIKCAQGNTLAGIEKGDTATIVLLFKPTSQMQTNVPVTGTIGYNVQYGNSCYSNYTINPVSDKTGTLVVEVADEFTYYTDEKPHVKDAEVVLRNSVTNAIVMIGDQPAQGKSGEDGLVTFKDLPEGYYKLSVTADNHDSYSNNILVDPGTTTWKTVNLSVETVKVSWTVEETEVEDVYEIVTTVSYETNVPTPVVDLVSPQRLPLDSLAVGESLMFYAIATNKGLINAINTDIEMPDTLDGIWAFEPMAENMGLTIAPQQSYIVPVKVTRLNVSGARHRASSSGCSNRIGVKYEWECGLDRKWNRVEKQFTYKVCPGGVSGGGGWGGGGGGGGLGWPGGGGGGGYSPSTRIDHVNSASDCDPCLDALGKWITECVQNFIPIWGCVKGINDLKNSSSTGLDRAIDTGLTSVACAMETCGYMATATIVGAPVGAACEIIGWVANGLTCVKQFIPAGEKCWKSIFGSRGLDARSNAPVSEYSYINALAEAAEPAEMEMQALYDYMTEIMGDTVWVHKTTTSEVENLLAVVATYSGEQMDSLAMRQYKPEKITNQEFNRFIERINNSRLYEVDGVERENMIHISVLQSIGAKIEEAEQMAVQKGYVDVNEWWTGALDEAYNRLTESKGSVCATISLQIKQTMTMTRQAFRGTLTVFNGNETTAMSNMKLNLVVSDLNNNVATAHEFQINVESLKNMEGEMTLDGGWTLQPNSEGTVTVLFIPTKYAAPTEPVDWSFGGTLSYVDPYTGLEITRELYPVTLTVKPSPELVLTYFMQRDVYGDDPMTTNIIEPMEDAEFALLINNKGYGEATNVKMVTEQPKIVENEKGLFIDFELVSSQVNGGPASLSFGQTIANDLGNIPAHAQTYAQWWLQSTLLGHFTSYDLSITHVTSYGNEDLSLVDIENSSIHELIHGFTPPAAQDATAPARAFLVNDIEDANDLPDQVYFTDATQQEVTIAQSSSYVKLSGYEYEVSILPKQAGWTYANLLDPTVGKQKLLRVVRKSDNLELPLDNVWQTSRSLRDGGEWLYESRLHFVGEMPATGETYVLTYEVRPEVELDFNLSKPEYDPDFVKEGLVTSDVDEVTITFTKPIVAETFNYEDVVYQVQGQKQDLSQVENFITPKQGVDNAYVINLSALNPALPNGYYVLSVQGAGITDDEGYQGLFGRKVDWVLFRGGLVELNTRPVPADGGLISWQLFNTNDFPSGARRAEPGGNANQTEYGNHIKLTAEPAEGYDFVNWTLDGEVVSTDIEYITTATSDLNFVANFKKKQYLVEVTTEGSGSLRGSGTGLYDFDTDISIEAVPDADFILKHWVVDGETVAPTADNTLNVNVRKASTVKAVFIRDIYDQTITLARGWNWISTFLLEPQSLGEMAQYANRLMDQRNELFRDPELGLVGPIDALAPGVAYKLETTDRFSRSMRGHLYGDAMTLERGWNWMAYPYFETKGLEVLTNPEEGDVITSQTGFSEYALGTWEPALNLTPGAGYLYKSAGSKTLVFDFEATPAAGSRGTYRYAAPSTDMVDIHAYPNTMNVTARIYRDGMELPGQQYNVYAMAGDELRGVSQFVGQNHYLTVYGDQAVEITFVVEQAETGETYVADETLLFRSDVVGSRLSPFAINVGTATGIDQLAGDGRPMTVYTLEGILVSRDATLKTLRRLPKGVYIVNGQKCLVR